MFRDERYVFVGIVVVKERVLGLIWGSGEGIESKEVGGDDREYHENVNS